MKLTSSQRLINLLKIDKKDVYQILYYAIFAGLVSLSLPLGIQAIINLIQSGRVSVSWIVLVFIVIIGVALVGILSLMQLRITENLQQKIFIRSSFEFGFRLPKITSAELYNEYPPELANRFFDTITIQKGAAKLLVEFSSALLQIVFGIILLSLYHSYFILFGIFLLVLLYIIFKFSYASGISTSIKESKFKYKVASWLQEIARNNYSFKTSTNFNFALSKNDRLVSDYLKQREKHFDVIKKQFTQLIVFKIIITAGLLLLGGYLVLEQQLNIGQFVAAEIIILLVINSVEKIVLGLETLYDMLTAVEKIGQITDLDIEEKSSESIDYCYKMIQLDAENISYKFPGGAHFVLEKINLTINQSDKIYLDGDNGSGKTTLIRILSGLVPPTSGSLYINDDTYRKINLQQYRSQIGTIISGETPFEGTLLENITFNNPNVSQNDLKWAIDSVNLGDFIKSLPDGLDTKLYPEGKQLSSSNAQKILLARSIITRPKILFYEDVLDKMDDEAAIKVVDFITSEENNWTVIVTSKKEYWRKKCTRVIRMKEGKICDDLIL